MLRQQQGNPSKKQIITINPTQLSAFEQKILHSFLTRDEQIKGFAIKVFEPNKVYHFDTMSLQFTHHLVRQTTHLPEINYKEYSYTIYHEDDLKGKGSFGSVYKVTGKLKHHLHHPEMFYKKTPSNKKKVIKKQRVRKDTQEQYIHNVELIKKENRIAQLARHTKTKKLTFQKNLAGEKETAYMVMKQFNGKFNKNINNPNVAIEKRLYITIRLIEALFEQIHAAGIVHRDIKPDNTFANLKNFDVNIFDFGLSRIKDDYTPCGTLLWVAPEVLSTTPTINNKKSDGYSMGQIIKKWWGDLTLDEDKKIRSLLLLKKKMRIYHQPALAESAKLNPIIEKDLEKYLRRYSNNDVIKNVNEFTQLLNKITHPHPDDRMSMWQALIIFSQLFYRAFSIKEKEILNIAIELKIKLYYLSFQSIRSKLKLQYLQSLINEALKKIEDTPEAMSFFLLILNIQAFKNYYRQSSVKKEVAKIIQAAHENLKKRNYLHDKLITEKNSEAISLYKKKPIFILDELKKWNAQYKTYFADKIIPVRAKKTSLFSVPSPLQIAVSGLIIAANVSIVIALLTSLPSGGTSLLIVLPFLGMILGALIGLSITANQNKPRSDLQQHGLFQPHPNSFAKPLKPQLIESANSRVRHEKNGPSRENVKS